MDLKELKEAVKKIAHNSGAKLVGVGSRERLKDAPPSGNMDYCLPGAQSCIIFAYPNPIEALESYFSKKERMSLKKVLHVSYTNAWKAAQNIAEFIEKNTEYTAFPVIPNLKYRKDEKKTFSNVFKTDIAYPDFSLRYGAVAAGLGHIGWSGNLVTKEYGGSLFLGGVLTTAPLDPDTMAEENNCNRCKICIKACTSGYPSMDEEENTQEVIIGGQKEIYSKRGTYTKCGISCAGLAGLSEDGIWTIWSPNHICLKKISREEWNDLKVRQKIMVQILNNPSENIQKVNKELLKSFALASKLENMALLSIEQREFPRCGNCAFICVADPKKRAKLYKMLKNSGKVFLDEKGREYVKKIDENGNEITYYPPTWEEYSSKKK